MYGERGDLAFGEQSATAVWLQQQDKGRQTQWRPALSQPAQPTCGQERGTADCDSGRRFSHAPSGSGSGSCGSSGGSSAFLHDQRIGEE